MSPTKIYVMAKVNGEPVHCLLDSGCERSVITKSIVPNVKLSPSRYILSTANKMDLPILGDTDLQITINGHRFVVNISVSPAIDEFFFWSDWLVKIRAK